MDTLQDTPDTGDEGVTDGTDATDSSTDTTTGESQLDEQDTSSDDLDFETEAKPGTDKRPKDEVRDSVKAGNIKKYARKLIDGDITEKDVPSWLLDKVFETAADLHEQAESGPSDLDEVKGMIQTDRLDRDKSDSNRILKEALEKMGMTSKQFKEDYWDEYTSEMKVHVNDFKLTRVESLPRVLRQIGLDPDQVLAEQKELKADGRAMTLPRSKSFGKVKVSMDDVKTVEQLRQLTPAQRDKIYEVGSPKSGMGDYRTLGK